MNVELIEKARVRVPSVPVLVNLVSKRVRQLNMGERPYVKPLSIDEDRAEIALRDSLEDWLLPYLGKVSRLSHFASLDLSAMLATLLPWPLPQRLDELAPKTLSVPSGSRIAIDYSEQPPVLAVRLQELFGLAETPRIAGGRQRYFC